MFTQQKKANTTNDASQLHENKKSKISIAFPSNNTSLPSIPPKSKEYRQIQSSIKCWIEGNQSELLRNGLNEEHYSIKAVKKGPTVIAHVECKLCHTLIKLQPKTTKKLGYTMEYLIGQNIFHFVINGSKQILGKQSLY